MWIVVTSALIFASDLIVRQDGARIEVGPGACGDLVMETLEGAFGDGVIAIQKDDVFACGHVDARVAGGRA